MLNLRAMRPSDTPDLLRTALEIYERDREGGAGGPPPSCLTAAAAELGLPIEYLECAAGVLQHRRERRRRWGAFLRGAALFGAGIGTAAAGLGIARGVEPPATEVRIAPAMVVAPAPPPPPPYWPGAGFRPPMPPPHFEHYPREFGRHPRGPERYDPEYRGTVRFAWPAPPY